MIIIDDFIQDKTLLKEIDNDNTFFTENGNYTWWMVGGIHQQTLLKND